MLNQIIQQIEFKKQLKRIFILDIVLFLLS
jgi:hypothetical protein